MQINGIFSRISRNVFNLTNWAESTHPIDSQKKKCVFVDCISVHTPYSATPAVSSNNNNDNNFRNMLIKYYIWLQINTHRRERERERLNNEEKPDRKWEWNERKRKSIQCRSCTVCTPYAAEKNEYLFDCYFPTGSGAREQPSYYVAEQLTHCQPLPTFVCFR